MAGTDHLGSTRMVIDEMGSLIVITRHDYATFGEELFAGPGIRNSNNGYSPIRCARSSGQKNMDDDTGLDFFEERYFSSVQGRFTSLDEFKGGPQNEDPEKQALPYADQPTIAEWNQGRYTIYSSVAVATRPVCGKCFSELRLE